MPKKQKNCYHYKWIKHCFSFSEISFNSSLVQQPFMSLGLLIIKMESLRLTSLHRRVNTEYSFEGKSPHYSYSN